MATTATETTIWNYLYGKIGNAYGVAGLMGNLYAESALEPMNLQNSYEKKLGYTDTTYTQAVDNGEYTNFAGDSAGYGLAQWTYSTRKAALLAYVQNKGASVGDLSAQLEFLYKELSESYKTVLSALQSATSVLAASNAVLTKYEKPADQSTTVKNKRAGYGQTYYDKYAAASSTEDTGSTQTTTTTTGGSTTMTESQLRSKVASWLTQYLGITEGSTEHKAILKVFNDSGLCSRYTMTTSDAWCAAATSAAFIACGLTSIFPCVECSCSKMLSLAQTAGIWKEDDSYTPSVGDVILYDWQDSGSGDNTGSPDHVGIVYSVSGTTMKIIEGNKSDTVAYRTLQVNGKYIRGYILPNYASVATSSASDSDTAASGSTLAAGTKITLSGASLYASAGASKASGTKTGTFYIWSNSVTNGRIRITNSAADVGKSGQITGWVNTSDCTVSASASSGTSSNGGTSSSSTATKKTATDSADSFLKSLAGTYKVTASALNVRNGAGTGKSVMVAIPKGTTVKNYGYYTTSGGVKWLYIQFTYSGVTYTGFASSAYLSKS